MKRNAVDRNADSLSSDRLYMMLSTLGALLFAQSRTLKSSCTLDAWVEHIVHIDGVTGSSPVATTRETNRKVRLALFIIGYTIAFSSYCL